MRGLLTVGGALAGAGAMFLLDPQYGRARRARAGAQVGRRWREIRCFVDAAARDNVNRARGIAAQMRGTSLRAARSVRGVRDVDDGLVAADGSARRPHAYSAHWAPSSRLLAALGGLSLLAHAVTRRTSGAWLAGLGGTLLLARAVANQPMRQRPPQVPSITTHAASPSRPIPEGGPPDVPLPLGGDDPVDRQPQMGM